MTTIDIDQILTKATRRTHTVPVCFDGALMTAQWQAEDALAQHQPPAASAVKDNRLSAKPDTDPVREQLQAALEQARQAVAQAAVPMTLRALSEGEWKQLVLAHPPREDNARDNALGIGYNTDELGRALITATLIEPKCTPEQVARIEASIDSTQWYELEQGAFEVCRKAVTIAPLAKGSSRPSPSSAGS